MLNGLLLLYGDNNRMSGFVYRLIHAVLTDDGVPIHGKLKHDLSTVIEAIQIRTGLRIRSYQGEEVESAFKKLNFRNQVAVCDTVSGGHSILLTGKSGGWIEAFDPSWHRVKRKREKLNAYVVQPDFNQQCKRSRVNVLIAEDYLLRNRCGRKGDFQMGAVASRNLIVMKKR